MKSDRQQADKIQGGLQDSTVYGAGSDSNRNPSRTRGDLTLILVLLAIFLFHSPFTSWWASLGLPWYSIFIFWFVLIALSALNQRKTDSNH